MIDIANASFHIDTPPLGNLRLEEFGTWLFDDWDSQLSSHLPFDDFSVRLDLNEGSLKGYGKVAVAAGTFYVAVGSFGSFISGLREIDNVARRVGGYLIESASRNLDGGKKLISGRRDTGKVGKLERLFERVQRGEMSPDEATSLAIDLFRNEPDVPQAFLANIETAIIEIPKIGKQLEFPGDVFGTTDQPDLPVPNRTRETRPLPPIGLVPELYRIEIWKNSKSGKREVSIRAK